jgi:hypothetical protein
MTMSTTSLGETDETEAGSTMTGGGSIVGSTFGGVVAQDATKIAASANATKRCGTLFMLLITIAT